MKLQASATLSLETLQSRVNLCAQNRLSLRHLAALHGRLLTPFALIVRRFTGKPLGVDLEAGDTSYWIKRTAERRSDDLKNQF